MSGHLSFTPRMKRVLENSLREAMQMGQSYISTEHLLLGIVREGEGTALNVLGRLGVKGDDIRVTLNGTVITEGNIAEASKNGTLDHRDHPGLQNKKGHIGFLGHGSEVRFRNIRIKELK